MIGNKDNDNIGKLKTSDANKVCGQSRAVLTKVFFSKSSNYFVILKNARPDQFVACMDGKQWKCIETW